MKVVLSSIVVTLKFVIYFLLLLEVLQIDMNFFTLLYMLMLYLLIRAQVGSVERNQKGKSQKFINLTKWIVFACFLVREVFIFVDRVTVNRL